MVVDVLADQTLVDNTSEMAGLIKRHDAKLARNQGRLTSSRNLYEGDAPLRFLANFVEDQLARLVINLPRWVVELVEMRLDVDGIRLAPDQDADDEQQALWATMDMPLVSHLVHADSLSLGMGFTMVGTEDNGQPVVTAESPLQVTVLQSNLDRRVLSAVKRWKLDDDKTAARTLFLPDRDVTLVRVRGKWSRTDEFPDDDHGLGFVRVTPFPNRLSTLNIEGDSEFKDVIPIYDALNKIATDMMDAAEVVAAPRRWAINVSEKDFIDEDGNPVEAWEAGRSKIWAVKGSGVEGERVELGQFPASDLRNFHETIKILVQIAGMLVGAPSNYLPFGSDNPASADSIRAEQDQLVKRTERKFAPLGASWRRTWKQVLTIKNGGSLPAEAALLEVIWRNAATPTMAALTDAAVKLTQGANPIASPEYAREMIGMTAGQRDRVAADLRDAASARLSLLRDGFTTAGE